MEYHSGQRTGSPIAVDYDKRMRVVPLETNARVALKEFEDTQKRIDSLLGNSADIWETDLDRHVTLNATTPTEVSLGSTLGREVSRELILYCSAWLTSFLCIDVVCLLTCYPSLRIGSCDSCA